MEPDQNRQLSSLLNDWRVDAPLPPRFSEAVWRRIEAGTTAAGVTLWQAARAWFEMTFARRAVALAYCSVLLAIGLGIGVKQGHDRSARDEARLETRYLESISPYYKVHP